MAESSTPAQHAGPSGEPNHGIRIFIPWLILSVVADVLIWVVWGPHLPPGDMSSSASGQQFAIKVMAVMAAPVMLFVLVYFAYALTVWRHREGDDEDGPPIHGNTRVSATWITLSSVIVLALFVFGTVELVTGQGSGSGEGASPVFDTGVSSHPLQVQVIAQQWKFTYRWPAYGGIETPEIELPTNTIIQFNVTSLDVIHSFWAYQLGVKADANPGINNIAYVTTKGPLTFNVRCAELCGLWHGYMFDTGRVVPKSQWARWMARQRILYAPGAHLLPPYAPQYFPQPTRRGG